jgi:gas vesicle protein
MKCTSCSRWITAAVIAALATACSDESPTDSMGAGLKQAGKDAAQTTKEVGHKLGDELAEAADGLEDFAKNLASNVSETTQDVGRSIEAKMPDVENLVEKAKAKLNVGTAEAKLLAAKLDDQLLTLKNKLAAVTRDGAQATKAAKDDVVAAFQELVASIKSGLR